MKKGLGAWGLGLGSSVLASFVLVAIAGANFSSPVFATVGANFSSPEKGGSQSGLPSFLYGTLPAEISGQKEFAMLGLIALILVVMWLLGMVTVGGVTGA